LVPSKYSTGSKGVWGGGESLEWRQTLKKNFVINLIYFPWQQILILITEIHCGQHGNVSVKLRCMQCKHNT
jgi:hypothetical protein